MKSLIEKHGLNFGLLDREFQLSSIEESSFPLREIIKKMESKLDYLGDILEEILSPSPESITNMHEYKVFTQEDKKIIFELYKQIQYLLRSIQELLIENDESEQVKLIAEIYEKYPNIKQGVLTYLKKMKDSWLEEDNFQEILEYFG